MANMFRQKRRTILTLVVIAFGMAMFVAFTGLIRGLQDKQKENLIGFDTAHLKIRNGQFDESRPYSTDHFLSDTGRIGSVLKTKNYVVAWTERISFLAEMDNGIDSLPVAVVGVDPVTDPKVFSLTNFFVRGGMKPGGLVVGNLLASDMKIGMGDTVYLTFRNEQGVVDSIEFSVTGIVQAAEPQVNSSTAFISLADAQKGMNTRMVSEIAVVTKDIRRVDEYKKDLEASLPSDRVDTWKKLGEYFLKFAQADAAGAYFFVFFMAIIAAVGVINTILLSVYEKRKEIGILKALGMTDRQVEFLFLLEGFWIGLWGCVIGLLIGSAINVYFGIYGIDFTVATANSRANIGYDVMGIIKTKWDIPAIVTGFITGVLISCASSYYPAKKASRVSSAENLRTI